MLCDALKYIDINSIIIYVWHYQGSMYHVLRCMVCSLYSILFVVFLGFYVFSFILLTRCSHVLYI